MGKNVERLDRLQNNRADFAVVVTRSTQSVQRAAATEAVDTVAANVQKAARTEAFEGKFGMTVAEALTKIRKDLVSFGEYQAALNNAIAEADEALQQTASGSHGLPPGSLSAEQQNTIDMAAKTDSPVQVSPGVTMTPAQAQQYYLDQAAAAQEEEARKLADALDQRLQEIIDGMPTSDYDEHKPTDEPEDGDGPGGRAPIDYPGVNGGGGAGGGGTGGVDGGAGIDGGGNGTGGRDDDGGGKDHIVRPPIIREPPVDPPVIEEPPFPRPRDEDPRIDGGIGGEIPGAGPGGSGAFPGGVTGGGTGSVGAGVGGVVGGAGLAGGAALANRLSGGAGLLAGGVGGVGGVGAAGGPGATGVVAQSGAAAGGRGGAMAGGAMAGGAGGAEKRKRRRGQDLMAFEVEQDDDEALPDIGSAGAAGRSTSEGREELGW
ncbi:hypothetical protein [Microbacterium hydrocarbonoxydans]|uniref:hypothetical protein n=1 Tax=Microbacterium hydrocarbonoxydans TaxID=273678 RepID=UPI00203A7AAA|nr:hypothetical protein [Microbacterium hydrocarbonoxydans]MCM3778138.1 hypothetical protein [Microbacterium hydrocarbonoxydans]